MTDYTKQCWSCKSKDMEQVGDYWRCKSCGATHTVLPTKRGIFPFEKVSGPAEQSSHGSPTAALVAQVARERERNRPLT